MRPVLRIRAPIPADQLTCPTRLRNHYIAYASASPVFQEDAMHRASVHQAAIRRLDPAIVRRSWIHGMRDELRVHWASRILRLDNGGRVGMLLRKEAHPAMSETAHCSHCDRDLPRDAFYADTKSATGTQSWCRECHRNYNRKRTKVRVHCPRCDRDLAPAKFAKRAKSPNGLQAWCRECFASYGRSRLASTGRTTVTRPVDKLFAKGLSTAEVARKLGISAHSAQAQHVRYMQRIGSTRVHHDRKADMVRRLLAGKSGLSIYETNGYRDDGPEGALRREYKKYGEVTSKSKDDGDWIRVSMKTLADGKTYDVVDVDGFRSPEELLLIGIARAVKPGGLLLLTFQSPTDYARHYPLQVDARMFMGTTRPGHHDCVLCAQRLCRLHGYTSVEMDSARYGNIFRVALRLYPAGVNAFNWKDHLPQIDAMFKVHDPLAEDRA